MKTLTPSVTHQMTEIKKPKIIKFHSPMLTYSKLVLCKSGNLLIRSSMRQFVPQRVCYVIHIPNEGLCPWHDIWKHLSVDSKDHIMGISQPNIILNQLMHSGCPHLSLFCFAFKTFSKVESCTFVLTCFSGYK